MTFKDLLKDLDRAAPFHLAQPWDRVGSMTGRGSKEVKKVLVSLDASHGALNRAISSGCDAWVTHHPLIWDPLKTLADLHDQEVFQASRLKLLLKCVEADLAVASCHTNWDAAEGGVNDALACALGLTVTGRFGPGVIAERLKMAVTLPADTLDAVIAAASEAGAGQIGLYSHCSFSWTGEGSFVPLDGASPTIGGIGRYEKAAEVRLEMALPASSRAAVEAAVRQVHPYEEPAFDWLVCEGETVGRLGVLASLSAPQRFASFVSHIQQSLRTSIRAYGDESQEIRKAALVGGAGSGFWRNALGRADVFVTGEVRQNDALEAAEAGLCIIEAGHYATEQPGMAALTSWLKEKGWQAELFEPGPGIDGRPFSGSLC